MSHYGLPAFFVSGQKLLVQLLDCKAISSATTCGVSQTALIRFLYRIRRNKKRIHGLTKVTCTRVLYAEASIADISRLYW